MYNYKIHTNCIDEKKMEREAKVHSFSIMGQIINELKEYSTCCHCWLLNQSLLKTCTW